MSLIVGSITLIAFCLYVFSQKLQMEGLQGRLEILEKESVERKRNKIKSRLK